MPLTSLKRKPPARAGRNILGEGPGDEGLHRRLVRTMLFACLVPLLLIGGATHLQFHLYAENMVTDQHQRLIRNHRNFIQAYLEDRTQELAAVARMYSLEQLREGELERVFSLMKEESGIYSDIGIIDDQGRHLVYLGPHDLSGRNYRGADWFRALQDREVYVSDLFLGYRAIPHYIIAVKRLEGDRFWILRATLSIDHFSEVVERVRVGSTGEAFLLDSAGTYQTKPLFGGEVLKPSGYPFLDPHEGVRSYEVKRRGETLLFTDVWMADGRWLLVFRQSKTEAFAPLRRALFTLIAITLAAVIAVSAVALVLSRRLVAFIAASNRSREELNRQLLASSKMAAVGEMAAGVAHEINNPLGIIETLKTWILDLMDSPAPGDEDREEIRDSARKIGDQVERCRRITHDLLKFSRRVESERAETDLNALLEEMVRITEHRAKGENIRFAMDLAPLPPLQLYPSEFQQVALNLLNNAVDAMERKGGTLTIRTRMEEGGVRVDVEDTGCGIPEEHISRIFEPFFTSKPVGKGTGLGLAVCYGLVQKMGGTLGVRSREGEGTRFTLLLPAPPESRPNMNKRSRNPGKAGGSHGDEDPSRG